MAREKLDLSPQPTTVVVLEGGVAVKKVIAPALRPEDIVCARPSAPGGGEP